MSGPPNDGGMLDARGRWVPDRLIRPIDRARHELVEQLAAKAKAKAEADARFEREMHEEIAAFVSLSAGEYGVTVGGKKGNVTLHSFDGRYRIVRAQQDYLQFDERLQVAKELVDACVHEWMPGATDELRTLVQHAFQVDKTGRVSTERVLSLRKIGIQHERWSQAMAAISDSIQVAHSKSFVRVYERIEGTDEYRPITTTSAGGSR